VTRKRSKPDLNPLGEAPPPVVGGEGGWDLVANLVGGAFERALSNEAKLKGKTPSTGPLIRDQDVDIGLLPISNVIDEGCIASKIGFVAELADEVGAS